MAIKKEYTIKEWDAREDYYVKEISGLIIPTLPDPKQIMELTSKLDALYTEAAFEYSFIKRKEEIIELDLKNAEAEFFSVIKQQQLTAGSKITENDIKGLVKTYIATNNIKGYNSDLYTLTKYYIRRSTFIGQVVKNISEKKQSIIATVAMLKIENSFSGARDANNTPSGAYAYDGAC